MPSLNADDKYLNIGKVYEKYELLMNKIVNKYINYTKL